MIISVDFDGLKNHIEGLDAQEQTVRCLLRLLSDKENSVPLAQRSAYIMYVSRVQKERERIIARRKFLEKLLDTTQKANNALAGTISDVHEHLNKE